MIRTVDDGSSLEQALVENLHRQDLNPLEEAAAYQQLISDFKLTHDEIAARVGRSRAAISNTLRLFQLSASLQRMVMDGQLSAGHARALLGTPDRGFQESLGRRVVAENMSVRAVEEAVKLRADLAQAKSAPRDTQVAGPRAAGLVELEQVLGEYFDTRVQVELGAKKGRIIIEVADLEDLERVYRAMTGPAV